MEIIQILHIQISCSMYKEYHEFDLCHKVKVSALKCVLFVGGGLSDHIPFVIPVLRTFLVARGLKI